MATQWITNLTKFSWFLTKYIVRFYVAFFRAFPKKQTLGTAHSGNNVVKSLSFWRCLERSQHMNKARVSLQSKGYLKLRCTFVDVLQPRSGSEVGRVAYFSQFRNEQGNGTSVFKPISKNLASVQTSPSVPPTGRNGRKRPVGGRGGDVGTQAIKTTFIIYLVRKASQWQYSTVQWQ